MSLKSAKTLAELLFTFSRQLKERLAFFEQGQLKPLHWGTLQYIADKGQPLVSEIADYLCITRPSVSSLLVSLQRSGYIRRLPDRQDKRAAHIGLTARGRAYLQSGHKRIEREIEAMVRGLSALERQQFIRLLRVIINYNKDRV